MHPLLKVGRMGADPTTDAATSAAEDSSQNFSSALSFFSSLFGGSDQVPQYPVKLLSTLNSLKASIVEHVGTLPPSSIEDAKIKLQKAIARQAYEDSIGHGYGDGVGWDTLQMLYDEVILGLKNYIAAGGTAAYTPVGPGAATPTTTPVYTPTTPGPTGRSNFFTDQTIFKGLPNWVPIGGAGVAIYFMTRKKRRNA